MSHIAAPMPKARRLRDSDGASQYFGGSPTRKTLEKWRITGEGPPFIKIGRSVRYDEADLDAWIDERRRSSTSDAA
ncbi:MAG: helix-turn-helix domain-containing protein [Gammaproteobacteria bacterium]|nr:helix-turn-helix domain-containing protein [Gammaproteobacteria bacterium]